MTSLTYFAGYGAEPAPEPLVRKPTSLEQVNTIIQEGLATYFGTRQAIAQAKANEAIAKAQYRGDVLNANFQASTGLPSPGILLMGGLGLAAVVLLTRSSGRR